MRDNLIRRLQRNRKKIELIGLGSLFRVKYSSSSSEPYIKLNLPIVKNPVTLRNQTIDLKVFKYVFYDQWHKPISEVKLGSKPIVVDLGTNIGLSILTFNYWFPGATIIGYEMDRQNYDLAVKNTSSLRNVHLVNKAVNSVSTVVHYLKSGREDAYSIGSSEDGPGVNSVSAVSMAEVLSENNLSKIDYLKMDVEGAEIDIFLKGDLAWLKQVENLNVEFHLEDDNDIKIYVKILEEQGFKVYIKEDHWASLTAIRNANRINPGF